MADGKYITLNTELYAQAQIIGDPDLLTRLFSNFLENALIFRPQMGDINIRSKPIGNAKIREISDKGPGMPDEELPRIFERFYQLEKSRQDRIVIGHSFATESVNALGGSISVYNNPRRGMIIIIKFPRYNPEDELYRFNPKYNI